MRSVTLRRADRTELMISVKGMHSIRYRTSQFLRQLDFRPAREVDSALAALLSPEQLVLVARLSPADRGHLLAVHRGLVSDGWTDPDLLTAALLHDVGKANEYGRVNVVHRVLKVVLSGVAPHTLHRLARERSGWLRHGLYLSLNHAKIGAEQARAAGTNERACWLIAHHDDGRITGDPALQALRRRDAGE